MNRGIRWKDLALLFGALGTFFLSLSMLIPTLPLYVRDLGGSPVEVGLVVGIFSLGVLAVRPFVGKAVDARGRRPLLLLGSGLVLAMAPLYAAFTAIAALLAVRLVHGAGLSAFTSASYALIADLSPSDRRTEYLGYLSSANIVAFAIGPLIGVELAKRMGYGALFAGVGVFALVSLACGFFLERAPRRDHEAGAIDYRSAILRAEVLVPTATLLLVTLAHGGTFTFLPILLEERLAFNFGAFFLVYSGASLLVRLAAGRISRRWGDGPMVWGGLAIYAVGLATLPWITDAISMSVAGAIFGIGFGTYQPAVYGLVANVATDRTRGMVFSVHLAAFDLGIGLGGFLAGPVVARAGIPALLYGLVIVPLVAAALFVTVLGWRPGPGAPALSEAALQEGSSP